MTDKTHFADDATLAYIAQLESELSAANARLAGIVEECAMVAEEEICECCWNNDAQAAAEHIAEKIRALAPTVAEKIKTGIPYIAEMQFNSHTKVVSGVIPAPIPQPAGGVVVPNREQLLSMAESCGIHFSRYAKGYLFASVEELERLAALLAAAQEPRK